MASSTPPARDASAEDASDTASGAASDTASSAASGASADSPDEAAAAPSRDESEHAVEQFIADRLAGEAGAVASVPRPATDDELILAALSRRGVRAEEVDGQQVLLLGGIVVGGLRDGVTTLVGAHARRVGDNAWLTKRHLQVRDVPVPAGRMHGPDALDAACAQLAELDGPATLKPVAGHPGAGITTGLRTEEQLRAAWRPALQARRRGPGANLNLLLETHHAGLDLRAFVVGDRVVSAIVRVPPHLVGDGASTVRELLEVQADRRRGHAILAPRTPHLDDAALEAAGLRADAVPEAGEVRILAATAGLDAGGLPVDVTDELADELAEVAADAVGAMPGLGAGAADLVTPRLDSADGAVVVDVEPTASLLPHHFPAVGAGHEVAGALADMLLIRASR